MERLDVGDIVTFDGKNFTILERVFNSYGQITTLWICIEIDNPRAKMRMLLEKDLKKVVEVNKMTDLELKGLLLSFCASLMLCEHEGEVIGDVLEVLKRLGYPVHTYEKDELMDWFYKEGIKTLYDTSLEPDEEDDEE